MTKHFNVNSRKVAVNKFCNLKYMYVVNEALGLRVEIDITILSYLAAVDDHHWTNDTTV